MHQSSDATTWLNQYCQCKALDLVALQNKFEERLQEHLHGVEVENLKIFSAYPVFINHHQRSSMQEAISAIEALAARPAFQEFVCSERPAIAKHPTAARSVFFGYDFHIGAQGPQLIEVNTNAGGAYYNLMLAQAQQACCPEIELSMTGPYGLEALEDLWVAMFRNEWQLVFGQTERPLRRIAIVDTTPTAQFLYPEFLLFQTLFKKAGFEALVCSPDDLQLRGHNELYVQDAKIDLVYNRTTDFYLEGSSFAALRAAYLSNEIVLTPHPRAYAAYADKRNLVHFTDPSTLRGLGVEEADIRLLSARIPKTRLLTKAVADELWQERRQLFFKPVNGYGSKAAYRGEKLTKKTWSLMVEQNYVAQQLIPPSQRHITIDQATYPLKIDLRNYTYGGSVQMLAARLYQGQTTNLRTSGGGFAPLYVSPGPR